MVSSPHPSKQCYTAHPHTFGAITPVVLLKAPDDLRIESAERKEAAIPKHCDKHFLRRKGMGYQ
jgi:hypothetical protein